MKLPVFRGTNRWALAWIALFFIIQCLTVWNGGKNGVFNSPDAQAQYYFTNRIATGKSLGYPLPEPSAPAHQYLFTRSTRVIDNALVPVGFLGTTLLYGVLSRLFFVDAIVYWTILFAAVALWCWYRLCASFFSERTGFLSLLLLTVHPAWWYYTNDSLFPNVLFVSLCLITAYAWRMSITHSDRRAALLAGAAFAAAVLVRGVEIVWLAPLAVTGTLYAKRQGSVPLWISLAAMLLVAGASVALVIGLSPLVVPFGYIVPVGDLNGSAAAPFSFHPRLIAWTAWNYLIRIFWLYTVLYSAALAALSKRFTAVHRNWFLVTAGICAVQLAIYGSWRIVDHPDPARITIGTSYVRYFLPVYILMIPLLVEGLREWVQRLSRPAAAAVSVMVAAGFGVFLTVTAITGSDESIAAKRQTLNYYDQVAGWIRTNLPEDAVVVASRSDKYVWPHRLVITAFNSAPAGEALLYFRTHAHRPLYYVGQKLSDEGRMRLESHWQASGLTVGAQLQEINNVGVYEIIARANE